MLLCNPKIKKHHAKILLFSVLVQGGDRAEKGLAWLEEQSSRYFNVSAVARRFNPMCRPYERTYDESSGLANCIERPELDPHRGKGWVVDYAAFSVPNECEGGVS